jgi:hypothetical protein
MAIAVSRRYPQAGDAGMSLWDLDEGNFAPIRTGARRYESGVYADEVLQHYFPPSMAVISNIAAR